MESEADDLLNESINNFHINTTPQSLSSSWSSPVNETVIGQGTLTVKSSSYVRWFALILMCMVALGSSFCFDNPAVLQEFMLRDLHISSSIFTLFYSVYSWPNVVLCLCGGIFIDKLGRRISAIIFCSLVLIGQLLFATGTYFEHVWLMLVGRVVFGIGSESQGTTMSTCLTHFFRNKELNLAFGIQLSFGRIGSSINMYATKPLYDHVLKWFPFFHNGAKSLGVTLYLTSCICLFSLIAAFILALVDYKYENAEVNVENVTSTASSTQMLHLPVELWLLSLVCVFYYISVFPFISVGIKFFRNRYKVNNQMASALDSFVMLFSAFLAPFLGTFIDRVGRNLYFVICAAIGTLIAHSILAFTYVSPILAMTLFSISYSILTASLWPLIVYTVNENQTGTAFGMMLSIQNSGLALMNMFSGYVLDNYGYFSLQLIMISNLLCSIAFSFALFHVDKSKGVFLNLTAKKRRELLAIRQTSEVIE